MTGRTPVARSGSVSTLICVALTYCTYTGRRPIVTPMLSMIVGSSPAMMALPQISVCDDRLVPRIVTHELGAIPAWKLAPLTTLVMTGSVEGGAAPGATWCT